MRKNGEYFYIRKNRNFEIYRVSEVTPYGSSADPVKDEPVYFDEEEARRRVYELNGWKWKDLK